MPRRQVITSPMLYYGTVDISNRPTVNASSLYAVHRDGISITFRTEPERVEFNITYSRPLFLVRFGDRHSVTTETRQCGVIMEFAPGERISQPQISQLRADIHTKLREALLDIKVHVARIQAPPWVEEGADVMHSGLEREIRRQYNLAENRRRLDELLNRWSPRRVNEDGTQDR